MKNDSASGTGMPPGPRGMACAVATAALLVMATSGCNEQLDHPRTIPVGGKVTYKGQPVPKGTITFQPDQGQASVGEIQPDGSYTLSTFGRGDGAVPGHHRIFVVANTADPTKIPGSSPGWTPPKDLVPKKYNAAETSGLETTVGEDRKEYNFDLP